MLVLPMLLQHFFLSIIIRNANNVTLNAYHSNATHDALV